jgi:tetratricopeptide (TPR) repeat protein
MIRSLCNELDEFHLKDAFDILRRDLLPQCKDGRLREEGLTLCDSYDLMLDSVARAKDDPDRRRIFEQMTKWGFEMKTRLCLEHDLRFSTNHYTQMRKQHLAEPLPSYTELHELLETAHTERILLHADQPDYAEARDRVEKQQMKALDLLFEKIWTSDLWTETEAHEMHELTQSATLGTDVMCVITSAILMGLMHHFDERKYLQLVGLCCHSHLQVSQRALVGVCLTLCSYYDEMGYLDSVWNVMDMLAELPNIEKRLETIQLEFIHACVAEKVSKQLANNVIPVVTRESQLLQEEMERYSEAEDDLDVEEMEAKRSEHQQKMSDKLRILNDWQRSGEDVYLSSFSALKHFSFFLDPAHWFYLFNHHNPYVRLIFDLFKGKQGESIRQLMDSVVFCNSDKYSFLFSLKDMPESQMGMFVQQLDEQREAMMENVTFHNSTRRRTEGMEEITRHYVQELNRFFKCWRFHHEMRDPFDDEANFWRATPTYRLVKDTDFLLVQIDLLRKWRRYLWASFCYMDLEEEGKHVVDCAKWRVEDCIDAKSYKEAGRLLFDMMAKDQDPVWAIRRLAYCARHTNSIDESLVLKRWVELEPDNTKAAVAYGKLLLRELEYEKALPYLHRWEFTAKDPLEALRSLTWALVNLNRPDEAKRYNDKVLTQYETTYDDWINAGHIAFLRGDLNGALERYRKALPLYKGMTPEDIHYSVGELSEVIDRSKNDQMIDLAILQDIIDKEAKEMYGFDND